MANYRSYVGPEEQYDLVGNMQFRLLCSLGLRESHRVLDFGCGSLRVGRLLIPYLAIGNYYGLDPNKWLIDTAIEREIGQGIISLRKPQFFYHADFRADKCGSNFDYIIAQSIFSHTGTDLIDKALESFSKALSPTGIAIVTFIHPSNALGMTEFFGKGWIYPGCVAHSRDTIQQCISKAGLLGREIPWYHPRQTWWILSKNAAQIPAPGANIHLLGGVLNVPCWDKSLNKV